MALTRGFLTGSDAKTNGLQTNLAVMAEINEIEKSISIVAANGKLQADIDFSEFTSSCIDIFRDAYVLSMHDAESNTNVNILHISNHCLATGQEVEFTSSGNMPDFIKTNRFYYAICLCQNNFLIATSQNNAYAGVGMEISSLGTGQLHMRRISESEKYQRALKNVIDFSDQRIYYNRIQRVLSHFQSLGYLIDIKNNPDTENKTFYWHITW